MFRAILLACISCICNDVGTWTINKRYMCLQGPLQPPRNAGGLNHHSIMSVLGRSYAHSNIERIQMLKVDVTIVSVYVANFFSCFFLTK